MADMKWPPDDALWGQYARNAAWYVGEETGLNRYGGDFWKGTDKHKLHLPIAADLAALAAGFLFCGSPTIKCDDEQTDERLQQILQDVGLYQQLLMAAELQSAYGGVFIKLNWNKNLAQRPIMEVVHADCGEAEYEMGIQVSATLYSELERTNNGVVYRLREKYTRDGAIESALFKGDAHNMGSEIPLTERADTERIQRVSHSHAGRLMAIYVPNKRPNKEMPWARYGESDFSGLYDLFDALDEAYSSLERDVRISKARVIVPLEYLRRKDYLIGTLDTETHPRYVYDMNEEVFTALDINPQDSGAGITVIQPQVRSAEILGAVNDMVRRIYMMAGYSPQSAGIDIVGSAESGTALNIRERRSMQTAEVKKTYWWHALIEITRSLLALDKALFNSFIDLDAPISVDFADNTQPDMQTIADTVQRLTTAEAISTEIKVDMVHPDWDAERKADEVRRIMTEAGKDYNDGEESPPSPEDGDAEADLGDEA